MNDGAALLLVPLALYFFYRGYDGYRRGEISWLRSGTSNREDDAVGFTTGVWYYVCLGLLLLWLALLPLVG